MNNRLIHTKTRELSNEEIKHFEQATEKWYPKVIQTYNTTLYDMVANPVKKAVVHVVAFLILVFLVVLVFCFINKTKISVKNLLKNKLYIGGVVFLALFIAVVTAIGQHKQNDNIRLIMTMTKPGATKYDYESSPVIRDKLLRNSYSRGGASFMGAGLGAMASTRRLGRR